MNGPAEDALVIANLKARYCAVVDHAATDPEAARAALGDIFTGDPICDYGMGPIAGLQGVADFLCTAIAGNSEWAVHMLHSPRIEIEGSRATGDWTVFVQLKRRAGGAIDTVLGRYCDRFYRTQHGWRLERVTFRRIG